MSRRQGRLRLPAHAPLGQERPADGHAGARPCQRDAGRLGGLPPAQAPHAAPAGPRGLAAHRRAREPARTGAPRPRPDDLRRYIDWQPFFNAWEMKGAFPDILNNPSSGPAARKLYDDAQEMLDQMIEEKWIRATAWSASSRPTRWATTWSSTSTTTAARCTPAAPPAPAGPAPRRGAQPVDRRLRRAQGDRPARPRRRLRGDRRLTGLRPRGGLPRRPRRLQRHPARVARRPARRGVRRAAPRAGAQGAVGLRARRAPRQRRAHQGAVRRHPAGAGLSRLPRAHREADAVGAPRRRGAHRHQAHRVDGDVARCVGQRLLLLPPAVPVLRGGTARRATRSPTTPSARAGRLPRPSGGSRPTSATTPRTDRAGVSRPRPCMREGDLGNGTRGDLPRTAAGRSTVDGAADGGTPSDARPARSRWCSSTTPSTCGPWCACGSSPRGCSTSRARPRTASRPSRS